MSIANETAAIYHSSPIPSHRGNPLIEALPVINDLNETIKALTVRPMWDGVLGLDDSSRIMSLDTLVSSFVPLPVTIDLGKSIDRLVRLGYVHRNPLCPSINTGFNMINAMSIIGVSGIGKSANLDRILSLYKQVIFHNTYMEENLNFTQLVYLKLNAPYDGSVKGLLYEFYTEIDRLLYTNYYDRFVKNRATVDVMLQSSLKVASSCKLGLLIIDEIQHITAKGNKSRDSLLNFLTTFSNTIGTPLIYVGTPLAFEALRSDFRQARRATGAIKTIIWDRHANDETFMILLKFIWEYQITEERCSLSSEIIDVFYQESQGIVDVLKKLFIASQSLAVQIGEKSMNPKIIKRASKESLSMISPMMDGLKSGNKHSIFKYKDIFIPEISVDEIMERPGGVYTKQATMSINQSNDRSKATVLKSLKNPDDIRVITNEKKESGLSAYEALKSAGYVGDMGGKDVLFSDFKA